MELSRESNRLASGILAKGKVLDEQKSPGLTMPQDVRSSNLLCECYGGARIACDPYLVFLYSADFGFYSESYTQGLSTQRSP
ncbi:hypothetical protein QBE54_08305 [Thermatribacter velox]|uniref:Uncharacterized protein n=1 Tax=Thermatribacter velox TaxID=3039681 RepID=A0ABZ2YD06_9BACT